MEKVEEWKHVKKIFIFEFPFVYGYGKGIYVKLENIAFSSTQASLVFLSYFNLPVGVLVNCINQALFFLSTLWKSLKDVAYLVL